ENVAFSPVGGGNHMACQTALPQDLCHALVDLDRRVCLVSVLFHPLGHGPRDALDLAVTRSQVEHLPLFHDRPFSSEAVLVHGPARGGPFRRAACLPPGTWWAFRERRCGRAPATCRRCPAACGGGRPLIQEIPVGQVLGALVELAAQQIGRASCRGSGWVSADA